MKNNLSFINITRNGRNEKKVTDPDFSVLFSPLSEYIYLAGHYEAIEEVIVDIDKAIFGDAFDGIEVGAQKRFY
ncbi:MAG: hypothetical protein EOP54_06525 [Sphingobacteriales bacterium]|nr:MAG: hypothetical protein EOP54_06525 [Sphingobacteriales bacterium]